MFWWNVAYLPHPKNRSSDIRLLCFKKKLGIATEHRGPGGAKDHAMGTWVIGGA